MAGVLDPRRVAGDEARWRSGGERQAGSAVQADEPRVCQLHPRTAGQAGVLTSSSPSRDENSFFKTAMSRREDYVSCIDVTIMDRSAHSALPSPYSKIFSAFRAGAAVTHAADLGGKRFIDFVKPHACVSAFILQHGSKCAPARIEHRLGQSGLCESGRIHIADEQSP